MQDIRPIPTNLIHPPRAVLRAVRKDSIEYMELVDSIRVNGLLTAISVTEVGEEYEVVAGNWRYNACKDNREPEIPCIVHGPMTLAEVLAMQVQENALNRKTTPTEFARQLLRISKLNPELTFGELARISGKNPRWVKQHFALQHLHPIVEHAVDQGMICATPAHYLAKFEPEEQLELLPYAKRMTVEDFIRLAAERIRQRRNKDVFERERARVAEGFTPRFFLRHLREVKAELENPTTGTIRIIKKNLRTPLDGWIAALKWMGHMDTEDIEESRKKFEGLQRTRRKSSK